MTYFCSKCELGLDFDNLEVSETPDGELYSCPQCFGPILATSDDDTEASLFTEEEAQYLTHLVDKQLSVVEVAFTHLVNIRAKIGSTL